MDCLVISGTLGIDSGSNDDFLIDGESVNLKSDRISSLSGKLDHILGVENSA